MAEKPKRIRPSASRPLLSDLKTIASSTHEAGHRLRSATAKLDSTVDRLPHAMRDEVREIRAEMTALHERAHALYRRLHDQVDALGSVTP